MRGKTWVKKLALAAGISAACTVGSLPAHAGFNTAELVSTTISQIPDCLDYRILGLSLRVIWTSFGPYFYWTLHVGHTVPAMVDQSHPYLDEMPWEEYSMLLGTAYREASEAIVHVGFLGLANNVEIGAGRYKHHKFGRHYAPQHYESAVIGHPAMIIFQKTGSGEKSGGGSGGNSGGGNASPGEQARRLSCPYPASTARRRGRRTAPCAAPGRTRHRRCDRAGSPRPGS